jgi:serine/threonine protein kinase
MGLAVEIRAARSPLYHRTETGETFVPEHRREITRSGAGFGSRAYMSPEQWGDAARVGPAADLYSLGVMLCEALTGRLPFKAEDTDGDLWVHFHAVPGIYPCCARWGAARRVQPKPRDRCGSWRTADDRHWETEPRFPFPNRRIRCGGGKRETAAQFPKGPQRLSGFLVVDLTGENRSCERGTRYAEGDGEDPDREAASASTECERGDSNPTDASRDDEPSRVPAVTMQTCAAQRSRLLPAYPRFHRFVRQPRGSRTRRPRRLKTDFSFTWTRDPSAPRDLSDWGRR